MTTAKSGEVARRRQRKVELHRSARVDLLEALRAQLETASRVRFPSPKYRADPLAFACEILGLEPSDVAKLLRERGLQREFTGDQVMILQAVRDHMSVAVKSGHKVGKSTSAAILALWFYCSFDDGRAIMSSTTARQVDSILWRELMMLRARSGRCVACKAADPDGNRISRPCPHSALIDGEIGMLARTGLKSDDFREIVGFTAREAEAVAGVSGKNLMYLLDEASGIPDVIFEAIEGNRAGGARLVMWSNPTRTKGYFFDAFHGAKAFWKCITISSEDSPNVITGENLVPGMATRAWIEERRAEWGEDSAQYKIRVLGEFALGEDGKIFSTELITAAEQRWADTPAAGRLFIGLDPAGPTGVGDDAVFAPRRGMKSLGFEAARGLSDEAYLARLLSIITAQCPPKAEREKPVVVMDRDGSVGARLFGFLRAYVESRRTAAEFVLAGVRASDRAIRQPQVYDRIRDELVANGERWFREGGAIPENVKLAGELHEPEWEIAINGRTKVTRKTDLRKALGRSPDHFDALMLSLWEPASVRSGARDAVGDDEEQDAGAESGYGLPDPYDGGSDPYA